MEWINRCGIAILGYRGNYKPDKTFMWYREKNTIKKMFLSLKSYLGRKSIRVKSIESFNALLFINFVPLILRHKLLKMMYDRKLSKKYFLEKLSLELSKIRKIILANGKEITSEITKKQRDVMESLNIISYYLPKIRDFI